MPSGFTGYTLPTAVSADGGRIAGQAAHPAGWEAVVWRRGQPPLSLGDFPGGDFFSGANAISRGGHLVLGFGTTALSMEASFWDSVLGFQHFGLTPPAGWVLNEIRGISADRRVIAGVGTNPEDMTEAWVVHLDGAFLGLADFLELWSTGQVSVLELVTSI